MGAALVGVLAGNTARAGEDLLERFRLSDATALDRARSLAQLGLTPDAPMLAQYAAAGVIRQTNADRFFLDETAYATYRRQRPRTAIILAVAAGLMAIGMALAAATMARAPH